MNAICMQPKIVYLWEKTIQKGQMLKKINVSQNLKKLYLRSGPPLPP